MLLYFWNTPPAKDDIMHSMFVHHTYDQPYRYTENKTFNMPPKTTNKNESPRKEDLKVEEPKNTPSLKEVPPSQQVKEEASRGSKSPKKDEPEDYPQQVDDDTTKRKKQAEMFKKYIDQTGIAMAFQVIFAEILDKKIEESKLFGYTAMRLRQIGQDLQKIKMNKK